MEDGTFRMEDGTFGTSFRGHPALFLLCRSF